MEAMLLGFTVAIFLVGVLVGNTFSRHISRLMRAILGGRASLVPDVLDKMSDLELLILEFIARSRRMHSHSKLKLTNVMLEGELGREISRLEMADASSFFFIYSGWDRRNLDLPHPSQFQMRDQ